MTGDDVRDLYNAALHIWNDIVGQYQKGATPIEPYEFWVKDAKQLEPVAKEYGMKTFYAGSLCGMLVRYDATMPEGEARVETKDHSRVLSRSTLLGLRHYIGKEGWTILDKDRPSDSEVAEGGPSPTI